LLVYHRASPGLPLEMARRMGGAPGSKLIENATLTCCHCRAVVIKNPFRQRERASCPKCSYKYLCDVCATRACAPDYIHQPMDKIVEQSLKGGLHDV
jgi:hypothetical protein